MPKEYPIYELFFLLRKNKFDEKEVDKYRIEFMRLIQELKRSLKKENIIR